MDLWDELPVARADGFVAGFDAGTGGGLRVGLLVDVEGEMAGLDERKVLELRPLIGWILYSGVAAAAVMWWALKLLAAMVAAAWMDLSVRSAGRGRECASLGKFKRAPLPLKARAAVNWHNNHPSTRSVSSHGYA